MDAAQHAGDAPRHGGGGEMLQRATSTRDAEAQPSTPLLQHGSGRSSGGPSRPGPSPFQPWALLRSFSSSSAAGLGIDWTLPGGGKGSVTSAVPLPPPLPTAALRAGPAAAAAAATATVRLSGGSRGGGGAAAALPAWAPAAGLAAVNLAAATASIAVNRIILFDLRFGFFVLLTALHWAVAAAALAAFSLGGAFVAARSARLRDVAPIAVAYAAFIVANNASIQINSTGFYQASKLAVTPLVVALDWIACGRRTTPRALAAVAAILGGTALCTLGGPEGPGAGAGSGGTTAAGVAAAGVAVAGAAVYQVLIAAKQRGPGAPNGAQLLHRTAPLAAALLLASAAAFEPVGWGATGPALVGTIRSYQLTARVVIWILTSSGLALAVAFTGFLFIGATSPVTFSVVCGHLRTALMVAGGALFTGGSSGVAGAPAPQAAAGVLLLTAGVAAYCWLAARGEEARPSGPQPVAAADGGGCPDKV